MSITSDIDIPEPDSCMEKCLMKTLSVISYMSTMRDPYTAHHQKRVAMLSFAIAKKLKLGKQLSTGIYLGALIHDIGKIKVPAEILSFPDKLSLEQYNLIKKHPSDGEKIIKDKVSGNTTNPEEQIASIKDKVDLYIEEYKS